MVALEVGAPTFSKTCNFPRSFVLGQYPQNVRISQHLFVFSSHQGPANRQLTLQNYRGPNLNGGRRQLALRVCGRSPRNHLAGPVPKRSSRSLGARCHVLPPVSQAPVPKTWAYPARTLPRRQPDSTVVLSLLDGACAPCTYGFERVSERPIGCTGPGRTTPTLNPF